VDVDISLRCVEMADRPAIIRIEAEATPNLRYLADVFPLFAGDPDGDFAVAEIEGEAVGCGKFTVMPDGTAWLEALRVRPDYQGLGVGKAFYRRFIETAAEKRIRTMRMYTNASNHASRGLAEHFGFSLAATYRSASAATANLPPGPHDTSFAELGDRDEAERLLMPFRDTWEGFCVMNRTFYGITPALCRHWTDRSMVYRDATSGSVIVLGARFLPERALHIALLGGELHAGLAFARERATNMGIGEVQCMWPPGRSGFASLLFASGFEPESRDYIVMEWNG